MDVVSNQNTQALRDWGKVISPDFNLRPSLFLIAGLIQISTWNTSGAREVYVNRKELYQLMDQSIADAGINILLADGYARMSGDKIVIGHATGIRTRRYFFEDVATLQQAPAQPQQAQHIPQPEVEPVSGNQSPISLEEMAATRNLLSEQWLAYEVEQREVFRRTDVADKIKKDIDKLIKIAVKGESFTSHQLINYMAMLLTIKLRQKQVIADYSVKETSIAKKVVETIPTYVLIELVPYMVFTWATGENHFRTATVQNLLGNRQFLVENYKPKQKQRGQFSGTTAGAEDFR